MRNRADKKLQTDRRTDRRTDGQTDRQADSVIPPKQSFGGYNNNVNKVYNKKNNQLVIFHIKNISLRCVVRR